MAEHGFERSAEDRHLAEEDHAATAWAEYEELRDEEAGDRDWELAYDAQDPKHPTFHVRMSDLWDMREGK
jgi:hypothetical protein